MGNGFWGRILRVDLAGRRTWVEEPDESFYRRYFGGWNFVAHYLLKETKPGIDALDPKNVLVFAPGIITGVPFSGSARNAVGAKSPLSNSFGETDVGGFWGSELKRAGWDAVVVQGRAEKPVYIWIKDDQVEIRDAAHLWGKLADESQATIRQEVGEPRARTVQIGPAGEKLVRFAAVINDLKHAGGRTGMGAVMGSKNLKAIATRGSQSISLVAPDKVRELARWMGTNADNLAHNLHTWGTGAMMQTHILTGNIPTHNFRDAQFPDAEMISAQEIGRTVRTKMEACYACSIRCKKVVSMKEPYEVAPEYGGPEYETLAAFGSDCGVNDLKAICKAHEISGAYGLDTISAGATIAFAMECFEAGLLTEKDTGGIALTFGNAAAMVKMTEMIARREGLGNLLAEGTMRAARAIGRGADRFAIHVKGEELPMHEPRYKRGLGLGYAVSPTGADHCHNFHDAGFEKESDLLQKLRAFGVMQPVPLEDLGPAKVRMFAYYTNWATLQNCMVLCSFVPWTYAQQVELVNAVTGWNSSAFELQKVGERALTLARAYNVREGLTPKDDWLPKRMFVGQTSGPLSEAGIKPEALENAKQLYYGLMGWDPVTGAPTRAKLGELDIDWVAEQLSANSPASTSQAR
jgi:aldehyde:ferredoxin oxidoreductase